MNSLLLHLGEVVIVRHHIGNDGLLVRMIDKYILCIEQFRQSQLILGHIERIVEIVNGIGLAQLVELYKIRPVLVNNGIERQTVPPGGREVPDVDVVIAGRLHLAPEQQRVLGALGLLVVGLLDRDVLDLEAQDYRPDEAESQSGIAVDYVVRAHVLEVDALLAQELQRLVDVLETVDAHFALGRPGQTLARQDLQEFYEHFAVAQVDVEVADARRAAHQVGVHPFLEGLLLD